MDLSFVSNPDALRAAYIRGMQRLEDVPTPAGVVCRSEIQGYEPCAEAHTELLGQSTRAERDLFKLMGYPEGVPEEQARQWYVGWRFGEVRASSDSALPEALDITLPVAYKVEAYAGNGKLQRGGDQRGDQSGGVKVASYVLHRPPGDYAGTEKYFFQGELTGFVAFEIDCTRMVLPHEAFMPRPHETLMNESITELRLAARRQAVVPWAADLVSLPVEKSGGKDISSSVIGYESTHSLRELLLKPVTTQEAVDRLAAAFGESHLPSLVDLYGADMAYQAGVLAKNPLFAKRFRWLAANVTCMRETVQQAVRHEVIFGFREAYMAKLTKEAAKVGELQELVASLTAETRAMEQSTPTDRPVVRA